MFVIAQPTANAAALNHYFIGAAPLKLLGWSYTGHTHLQNCAVYESADAAAADLAAANAAGFRCPEGMVIRCATAREQVVLRLTKLAVALMRGNDWNWKDEMFYSNRKRRVLGRVA